MANFKRRKVTEFTSGGPLDRATLLASITTSFFLFTVLEIICFWISKINIIDVWYTIFLFLVGCVLMAQLFSYIYIAKKRYEYIISSEYKPFKLRAMAGAIACFLLFLASMLATVAASIFLGHAPKL
jgi:hypothetical protein